MSILCVVLLFITACCACDPDLHYRINNGVYLIVNPDSDTYNGIQAYDENGDECVTAKIEFYAFTVTDCGLANVQVDLLTNDTVVTSCTISSDGAERSQSGVSLPLNFVTESQSILGPGSAHYHCQIRATASSIIVKNPRSELYKHSLAQSSDGVQCITSHILDNEAIEISECTVTGVVLLVLGSKPIQPSKFIIARQVDIFEIDCSGIDPAPVVVNSGQIMGLTSSFLELTEASSAYSTIDTRYSINVPEHKAVVKVTGQDWKSSDYFGIKKCFRSDFGINFHENRRILGAFNGMENNDLKYNCYDDGSIMAVNPRSELFCFSYAEQNGVVCNSVYVKTFSQVIISGCDQSQPIFLLLSKIPIIDSALVIRPNNVFLINCSA